MKKGSPLLLPALCLALLTGCGASSSGTGSAQFAVSVPRALSSSISRVTVTASGAEFPAVSGDLVFSNGLWSGLLGNLPVGSQRTFQAQAFDTSGALRFEGSASGVSIAANQTSLVAITLQQVNAPPPFQNETPLIDSLVAPSTSVSAGGSLSLTATAHDPNPGDTLSYGWSSTAGSFSTASTASTSWTAPASPGIQTLTLTVTDSRGLSSSISLLVNVLPSGGQGSAQLSISFNTWPAVAAVSATVSQLAVGQTTGVSASASDGDGDTLSYAWSASCAGSWAQASSRSAQFTPSALPGGSCNNCELTVTVSDGRGAQSTGTVELCVSTPPAPHHLPPFLLSASASSGTATPGQVITYEVVASDPEGSALSFSWSNTTGALGSPATTASSSRITWTAPSCVSAGAPPALTATITNAFHLTATQHFSVTGLPVCAPSSWTSAGSMASPRWLHTATLLPNGKVLVAGGINSSGTLATAELYDPASGTWSATGPMRSRRTHHKATLLPNGKVLVSAGGEPDVDEVYDPASGTWSAAGTVATARVLHTATLLPNGQVLMAGGINIQGFGNVLTAEVFDPTAGTGSWSTTGTLAAFRFFHIAALLPNGKVLVAGGVGETSLLSAAEVYDPALGTWSPTGSMTEPRAYHVGTLLPNGKVFVAGGQGESGYIATAEVYDPALGTWSAAASMASPRSLSTATLLPNGQVLVAGGTGESGYLSTAEVYAPGSNTWSATASMATARSLATATLLLNGQVLVVGGQGASGYLASAELYTPGTP